MRSTIGVVIKKQNRGEYDQLITALTKGYGKVNFLCRGVRRGKAKLTGHLGLFSLTTFGFVLGRRFKVLTTASEVEHFSALKRDLAKIKAARHIVRLVDTYTVAEEKDEGIFNLMVGALDYLNRREMKPLELKFFLRYFEFRFLSLLGYEPEDKTIVHLFESQRIVLSERDLDRIANLFSKYFQDIYSKV